MLKLRPLNNYQELKDVLKGICDRYNDPLFPTDYKFALSNIFKIYKSNALLVVIEYNDKAVGLGAAAINAPYLHSREKEVSQMYYQTSLEGIPAVKALMLYHKTLVEYAKVNGISKCTSTSIMDNQDVFYRVLEKEGWIRRGCVMVYLLDNRNTDIIRLVSLETPEEEAPECPRMVPTWRPGALALG